MVSNKNHQLIHRKLDESIDEILRNDNTTH